MIASGTNPTPPDPLANGSATAGRDPDSGKFMPGNKAAVGRGNPHASDVAALRAALYEAVTPARFKTALEAVLSKAENDGDIVALREIADRAIGKPSEQGLDMGPLMERLEALEALLIRRRG